VHNFRALHTAPPAPPPPAHFSDDELEKIVVYLGKYDNTLFKLGFDWNQKKQQTFFSLMVFNTYFVAT